MYIDQIIEILSCEFEITQNKNDKNIINIMKDGKLVNVIHYNIFDKWFVFEKPEQGFKKQYWTFKNQINPGFCCHIVSQDIHGEILGDKKFKDFLIEKRILQENAYVPDLNYLKELEQKIQNSQSGLTYRRKVQRSNNDD